MLSAEADYTGGRTKAFKGSETPLRRRANSAGPAAERARVPGSALRLN